MPTIILNINFDKQKHHNSLVGAVRPYQTLDDLPDEIRNILTIPRAQRKKPLIALLYIGGTFGMILDPKGRLIPTENIEELLAPLFTKGLFRRGGPRLDKCL